MRKEKQHYLYEKGNKLNKKKARDERGRRIKQVRQEGLAKRGDVQAIENSGFSIEKRNRTVRRKAPRRHR